MNDFEKTLINLLDECARLPIQEVKAFQKVKGLPSFEICRQAFEKDSDFADAARLAGFWGTFDAVFQEILDAYLQNKGKKITFNKKLAIRRASELRNKLSASNVHFTANARLLGVKLTSKEIILSGGFSLNRLTKKEREDRLSHIGHEFSDFQKHKLFFQPTEIRFSLDIPLDKSNDNAFFEADNEAHRIAHNKFMNVLNGLLLVKDGRIELGPRIYMGGSVGGFLLDGFELKQIPNATVIIKEKDSQKLIKAIDLVSGESTDGDQVLSRALHRFLLGRKRSDLVDKFIDYVISWESLLLTIKGDPRDQELSYRFSINGASLIAAINKSKDRKKYFGKMRSIYRLRSNIVHGGDDSSINKNIKKGDFKDLKEVCEFLENNFRKAIWWLIKMKSTDRPYLKVDGWEDLLWS